MSDYWTETAARLQTELDAHGIKHDANDDIIAANVGEWFADLGEKTKAAVKATMHKMDRERALQESDWPVKRAS